MLLRTLTKNLPSVEIKLKLVTGETLRVKSVALQGVHMDTFIILFQIGSTEMSLSIKWYVYTTLVFLGDKNLWHSRANVDKCLKRPVALDSGEGSQVSAQKLFCEVFCP